MTITKSLAQVAELGLKSKESIIDNEIHLDESSRPNELQFNALASHASKAQTFDIWKLFLSKLKTEVDNYSDSERYQEDTQVKVDIEKNISLQIMLIFLIGDVENTVQELTKNTRQIIDPTLKNYIETNKDFFQVKIKIDNFLENKVNNENSQQILKTFLVNSIALLNEYQRLSNVKKTIQDDIENLKINKKYLINDLQQILQSRHEDIGKLIGLLQDKFQIYEDNRKAGIVQFAEEDILFLRSIKALFNSEDNYKTLQDLGYETIEKDEQTMKDILIFVKGYDNMSSL